jgi:hypothetical protein
MDKKIKIIIIIVMLFISIPLVFAATTYSSSNVVTDNTNTKFSIYLQDSIDDINYFCSVNCPQGKICKNNTPICKRATKLHKETCAYSDYCRADGYVFNDTITYGNTTTTNGVLTVGDAFDCDVNGDGIYDSTTERFYYISDYYDTSTKTFNDKVAILVYYSNTDDGVASTTNVAYDCSGQNYNGPVTAISELPTTTQWSNIRLYKSTRQILAQNNATAIREIILLPTNYDYSGYSARLLTYQEINHGCYDYNIDIGNTKGLSTNCKFLFERTKYATSSSETYGSWAETPYSSNMNLVSNWSALNRIAGYFDADYVQNSNGFGVRPAIEVLKSEISY